MTMLNIDPDKVGFIIMKAREFEIKVVPADVEAGGQDSGDDEQQVYTTSGDDPTYQEIRGAINQLNIEDQYDLVALMWLGRGTFFKEEWADAVSEAKGAHNDRTAEYLLGTPLLPDYLEDGLSQLGYSLEDIEADHL